MSFISSIATEEDIEDYIRSQHKCVGNKEFSMCANYGLTCQVNIYLIKPYKYPKY